MNNGEMGKRKHTFCSTPAVGMNIPQTFWKGRQKMVPITIRLFSNRNRGMVQKFKLFQYSSESPL
jgi:hypothetical protein